MRNILSKNKGASMLLAICIFMFLVVLGFNVLAAASSNINNTSEQFENEQAMQYVNSIYEIVDGMIRAGEFVLPDDISGAAVDKPFVIVTANNFKDKDNIAIDVNIEFYNKRLMGSEIEAKIKVTYKNRNYTITSLYSKGETSNPVKYNLKRCKGVESSEI